MRRTKKNFVIANLVIVLIVILILIINALASTSGLKKIRDSKAFSGSESLDFNFIVNPEESRVKKGETVTIIANVQNIAMGENGLNNVIGKLSYDEDLFEELTIQTEKDWLLELNQQENHSLYGKFAIYTLQEGVTTGQNLVKFNFKLKSDLEPQTTEITFTDLKSSDGEYSVNDEDKKIKIIIYEDEVVSEPEVSDTDSKNTESGNSDSNEVAKSEAQFTNEKKTVQTGDVVVSIAIILITIAIGLNIAFWGKKSRKKVIVAVIIALIGLLSAGITTFAKEIDYDSLMNRLSVQEEFLKGEKYLVTTDKISRVAPETTVEEFKTKLNKPVTVKNNESVDISNQCLIGTGMKVNNDDEGIVYEVSVVGDLDGDGDSNQVELTTIIRAMINFEKMNLTGSKLLSADMNSDGNIDIKDVNLLVKYIVYGEIVIPTYEEVEAPSVEVASGMYNNYLKAYEDEFSIRITEKEENALKTYYKVNGTNEGENGSNLPKEYIEIDGIATIDIEEDGVYKISAYTIGELGNKSEISTLIVTKKMAVSKIIEVPIGTETMVNNIHDLILNHEYGTLEEALNDARLANKNGGTVKIKLLNNIENESNEIMDGNNIILDLNGFSITSTEGEPTLKIHNAELVVIDNSSLETGKIENTAGIGVYITTVGTLILGQDIMPIKLTTPQIIGTTYGVYKEIEDEAQGTFRFFDGKIEGNIAISGIVDEAPLLYTLDVTTNDSGKQVGILKEVTNVQARIGKKTYLLFSDAVDEANNVIGTSESSVEIDVLENITMQNRQIIEENKNIILDLNGHTITTTAEDYVLENKGQLQIKDSTATAENPSGNGKITSTTYNTILNSLGGVSEPGITIEDIVDNGSYGFAYTLGQLISKNTGIASSVATGYIPIDLTGKDGQYKVTVNAEVSSESGSDVGYARITDNTNSLAYNDEINRFIYISGDVAATDYIYSEYLEGGNVYYLHFGYKKDSGVNAGDDQFKINEVEVSKTVEANLKIVSGNYYTEYAGTSSKYSECITNNSNLYIGDEQESIIVPAFHSTKYSSAINTYGNTQVNNINLAIESKNSNGILGNGNLIINDGNFTQTDGNSNYILKTANAKADTTFTINNCNFDVNSSDTKIIQNNSNGEITIKTCNINSTKISYGIINNNSTGNIIIDNGTYECEIKNSKASGEIVINNGDFYGTIRCDRGCITINKASISTTGAYAIYAYYSNAIVNIVSATISTKNTYAIFNSSGIVNIQDGEITSNNVAIYNVTNAGTVNINGGKIKSTGNTGIFNKGILNITGGDIQSTTQITDYWGIINADTTAIITIGKNDDEISTTCPNITGYYGGIYNKAGCFNYYDGIIKSYGQTIEGTITSIPTDTEVKSTTENEMNIATLAGIISQNLELVDTSVQATVAKPEKIDEIVSEDDVNQEEYESSEIIEDTNTECRGKELETLIIDDNQTRMQ